MKEFKKKVLKLEKLNLIERIQKKSTKNGHLPTEFKLKIKNEPNCCPTQNTLGGETPPRVGGETPPRGRGGNPPPQQTVQQTFLQQQMLTLLNSFKFNKKVKQDLISRYSLEYLKEKIGIVQTTKNIKKSREALLLGALANDYKNANTRSRQKSKKILEKNTKEKKAREIEEKRQKAVKRQVEKWKTENPKEYQRLFKDVKRQLEKKIKLFAEMNKKQKKILIESNANAKIQKTIMS